MSKLMKIILIVFGLVVVLGLLIQLVPYGHNHNNPPVVAEPQWDSARTRELFMQACGDCHSNETIWPWYSNVAPVSWLVQHDVDEGRQKLNISEWGTRRFEAHEAAELIQQNQMPPAQYFPTHPEARLSDSEKQELINGLNATFGGER
jgi:mono/diheme cytochrome c family protein